MKQGEPTNTDLASTVEAIKHLEEDDLLYLNKLIVDRLDQISQEHTKQQMAKFSLDDAVCFVTADSDYIQGTVYKFNKKTISVIDTQGDQWNVPPDVLMHRPKENKPPKPSRVKS